MRYKVPEWLPGQPCRPWCNLCQWVRLSVPHALYIQLIWWRAKWLIGWGWTRPEEGLKENKGNHRNLAVPEISDHFYGLCNLMLKLIPLRKSITWVLSSEVLLCNPTHFPAWALDPHLFSCLAASVVYELLANTWPTLMALSQCVEMFGHVPYQVVSLNFNCQR